MVVADTVKDFRNDMLKMSSLGQEERIDAVCKQVSLNILDAALLSTIVYVISMAARVSLEVGPGQGLLPFEAGSPRVSEE